MTNALIPFPFRRTADSEGRYPGIAPLLDLALSETHSQGAYVYRFEPAEARARILLWAGPAPAVEAVARAHEVGGAEIRNHFGRATPIVLDRGAGDDPRFQCFPEIHRNRFEGVVSSPLFDGGAVAGLLNVCRSRALPLQAREVAFLLNLSEPIGSLMAGEMARALLTREVDKLTQQLADRKLMERAKGLLQSSYHLTEEQAYFAIRNASRRARTPMRQVAEQVIEGVFPMAQMTGPASNGR